MLAIVAAGCSADGIHSPQSFFPGSERTSWNSCDKFGVAGNDVQICASTGLLPGQTAPSYNIQFSLPNVSHVRIAVFDSKAAQVVVLLDADEPATLPGLFRLPPIPWNYTDASGKRVPQGNYRIYFQAGAIVSTSDLAVE